MSAEENYIRDLGREIVLLAERGEVELRGAEGGFECGRRFAIYEVLSLMSQQARAFGLTDSQIGLEGIDIESFLK